MANPTFHVCRQGTSTLVLWTVFSCVTAGVQSQVSTETDALILPEHVETAEECLEEQVSLLQTGHHVKLAEKAASTEFGLIPVISSMTHYFATRQSLRWEEKCLIGVSLSAILAAIYVQWRQGWTKALAACFVAPYIVLTVVDYLMVRRVQETHGGSLPFNTICAVIVLEFSKLVVSVLLLAVRGELAPAVSKIKFKDVWHLSIPAGFYLLNNSLHYFVLSRVNLADFAIVLEMQIVFVAILWAYLLNRRLSAVRIIACMGVVAGVMIHRGIPGLSQRFQLTAALALPFLQASVIALGCVSNEHAFKLNQDLDINAQNICLYGFGVIGGFLMILVSDHKLIGPKFFDGLNYRDVVFLLSIRIVMGLVVSRILKFVDSVTKTIACSISGPLALGFAPGFIGEEVRGYTVLAAAVTYLSSFLYWTDPDLLSLKKHEDVAEKPDQK